MLNRLTSKAPSWLFRCFRLSKRDYFLDFFITPPITAALAILSLLHGFGILWIVLALAGFVAWTLYEYLIHLASHHAPWLSEVHWLHHRNMKEYIGVHPLITIAIYATVWALFGIHATPFAVGFSVGYVIYAALHTAFHYAQILPGHPLFRLKERHVVHHRFHDRCFGVTTNFWDRVFRTA